MTESFLASRRTGWVRLSERSEICLARGRILCVGVAAVLPGEVDTKPVTKAGLVWDRKHEVGSQMPSELQAVSAIPFVLQSSAADHQVAFALSLPFAPSLPKDAAVPLQHSQVSLPTAPSLCWHELCLSVCTSFGKGGGH